MASPLASTFPVLEGPVVVFPSPLRRCRSSPQNNPKPFFLLYCLFWLRQFRLNSGFDRLLDCLCGLCTKSSSFCRRLLSVSWTRLETHETIRFAAPFSPNVQNTPFLDQNDSFFRTSCGKKVGSPSKGCSFSRPGVLQDSRLSKCLPQGCYPNLYLPKRAKLSRSAIIF